MKKYCLIFSILFSVSTAFADGWDSPTLNKLNKSDTVYVDSHKVSYVVDSSANNLNPDSKERTEGALTEAQALNSPPDLRNPPYTRHRVYVELVAQNLAPGITYEYLFADFWSVSARLSYSSFSKKNITSYTDVEGEMDAFSIPLMLRWYFGRRNSGMTQVIDATGDNHEIGQKSQMELFLQLRLDPVFYAVDLTDPTDQGRLFDRNQNGLAAVIGFGTRHIGTRFFWGTEINFGRFVKKPQFMEKINVRGSNKYIYTRLLEQVFFETNLSVGFVF